MTEKEERREWEREKQMRDKLAETEKEKREGQAVFEEKGRSKKWQRKIGISRRSRNRWRWPSTGKDSRLAKGRQHIEGRAEMHRKLVKESS